MYNKEGYDMLNVCMFFIVLTPLYKAKIVNDHVYLVAPLTLYSSGEYIFVHVSIAVSFMSISVSFTSANLRLIP